MTVSEGNYAGGFVLSDCSPFETCQSDLSGGYECFNGSSGNSNRLGFDPATENANYTTIFYADSNPVGTAPALSCTFTFSDQQGHKANYTINVAAAAT